MKRTLILLTIAALLLSACATVAPPTRQITQVDGSSITVAANGEQATYKVTGTTTLRWANGDRAYRSELRAGLNAQIWANEGVAKQIVLSL